MILRVTKVSPRVGPFVVEEDPVAGEQVIRLAIVHRGPVGKHLGAAVRAARIERRGFALRSFLNLAVEFRSRGLIKTRLLFQAQDTNRLQQPQRPQRIGIGRVFRLFERYLHVALGREVVDFIRLDRLHDTDQAA